MDKKKAFTLVELVTVIVILSILSAIWFVSLQGYGSQSRDAVRISDLNSIDKALELSKVDLWEYPDPVDYDSSVNNWKQWVIWDELIQRFKWISNVPVDPVSKSPMWYATTLDNKEYQLMYSLESKAYNNYGKSVYARELSRSKVIWNYNTFYLVWEDQNYYAAPSLHSSWSVFFIDGENIDFTSEVLLDQSGGNINASNIKSKYSDFTLSLLDKYENINELDDSIHTELKWLDRNDEVQLAEFAIKLLWHNPKNIEKFILDNPGINNPVDPSNPDEDTPPSEWTNPPSEGTDPWNDVGIPWDETSPSKCVNSTTPTEAWYFNFDWVDTITWLNWDFPKNIVIPCEINGKKVTHIWNRAFILRELESIVLSDNIKSVWFQAFISNNLTSIDLWEGLETIWEDAFRSNNISNVTIPDSVISIWNAAFQSSNITTLTLWNNLETIWEEAFRSNTISNVTIPDSVISIWNKAFWYSAITELTLWNNLETIWSDAFRSNTISSVTIPDSVISIWNAAFHFNNITTLTLWNNLETIWSDAFKSNDITQLVIPDNVTSIWAYAFRSNNITQLIIPAQVTNIWESAFRSNDIFELTILWDSLVLGLDAFSYQWREVWPIISPKYFCDTYYNDDYIDTGSLTSCSQ